MQKCYETSISVLSWFYWHRAMPTVSIGSVAFSLRWQRPVAVTQTIWSAKPKTFTTWPPGLKQWHGEPRGRRETNTEGRTQGREDLHETEETFHIWRGR